MGMGIEETLIRESLSPIRGYIGDSHSKIKSIIVTTRAENKAQELYKKTLDEKVVAVIKDLYAHDEVTMMAKDV